MKKLIAIILCLVALPVLAENVKKPKAASPAPVREAPLTRAEEIAKIEQYLNNISNLTAKFQQEDSEGVKAEGIFYLSRPGKLRWDYAPPTPVLIVARGSLVAYYDRELDELSHISLDNTVAGFLTRKKINFSDNGIKIIGFGQEKGEVKITITQNSKEEQGNLTMIFDQKTTELLGMEVVDAIGKTTIINFTSRNYNAPIDKEMFVFPRVKPKKL